MFEMTAYRVKSAWRGLIGDLPKRDVVREVEVAVLGEPHRASLYRVGEEYSSSFGWTISFTTIEEETGPSGAEYYLTCEQAHAAWPGKPVVKVDALRVGRQYVVAYGSKLREVKIGKQKVAKGKKR